MPVDPDSQGNLELFDNGWLTVPWAEKVPERGPLVGDAALSYEGGNQAAMTIQVFPEDIFHAIVDLLGTNLYNPSTGNLDRTLPVQHPIFYWMYATRITSVKGIRFDDKGTTPGVGIPLAVPDHFEVSILFTQPKYRMLADWDLDSIYGSPRQEWRRFIEGYPVPKTEYISAEANDAFSYQETGTGIPSVGAATGINGPTLGEAFPSPWGQPLRKNELQLLWRRVPIVGLLDQGGVGRPSNLLSALFQVNENVGGIGGPAWNDYVRGIARFDGYQIQPIESPVPPVLQGAGIAQLGLANLVADVQLTFSIFDPTYDTTANASNPTRGHNLLPFRANGIWYLGKDKGGNPLFAFNDYSASVFKLQS